MFRHIRLRLRPIIESNETPPGKVFDFSIQTVILLSVVSYCLQTVDDLGAGVHRALAAFEVIAVSIFTVEYLLRLWVAEKRMRFIFSFFGLIDLIAIAPFYLSFGVDLRALRAVRFFRLFRAFKLLRYSEAMKRYARAFRDIRDELAIFAFASALVLFFASAGIHHFESDKQPEAFGTIFDCLWWSIVTLTTVGYGDVYPVTVGGKIFTAIVLFVGLGFVAVPTGLFASALTKTRESCDE